MDYAEAIKQLNSYYVHTNKYEFCLFNIESQYFIKIVSYENNFSIIFDNYLLYYGTLANCPFTDLSPASLVKKVPGRSKIPLVSKKMLKIPFFFTKDELTKVVEFYKYNDVDAMISYASYLYNTPEFSAYYVVNMAKHEYVKEESASLSIRLSYIELSQDSNKNISDNFFNVIPEIWSYTEKDILNFISPDYLMEQAFEHHPEKFAKLRRYYNIDKALSTL